MGLELSPKLTQNQKETKKAEIQAENIGKKKKKHPYF